MRLTVCKHCDDTFDRNSRRKREVGGYIDECPSCVLDLQTETAETIRGVVSGDGKMAALSIVKFESDLVMQIKGTFIAQGTADNKITFTSNSSFPGIHVIKPVFDIFIPSG